MSQPSTTSIAMQPPDPAAVDAAVLLDAAETGLFVELDGRICFANPALARAVGWELKALIGQPSSAIVVPEHRERMRMASQRRLAGKPGRPGQLRCLRSDGSHFDARAVAVRIEVGCRPAVLITLSDVSDLVDAVQDAAWKASMLSRSERLCRSGSFEIEMPAGRLQLSAGLAALVGQDGAEGVEAQLDQLGFVPPEERELVAGIWRSAVAGEPFEFQHRLACADGRKLIVIHRGVLNPPTGPGQPAHGIAILQDITAQREAEQQLQEVANHNEVSGLPNRAHFLDQIDAACHAARWSEGSFSLLALDVPRIAEVKATMGFGAGDTLAMALAARLREACGPGESVAHLGETEFALLIEHGEGADAATLTARAARLQSAVEVPVRLAATDIFSRCLIGIASFPTDGDSPIELLERAQTARVGVGADGVAFYRVESSSRVMEDMRREAALRLAIERQELSLVYQPQVDLATGAISGAEALLRWHSAELGEISPSVFIPLAERSGLIGAIGDWVLQQACLQVAAWQRAGLPPVRVGVNLSPAQLQRPDLAAHIQSILLQTGAEASRLGIELTEGMAMTDVAHATTVLGELKCLGLEVSLDDFGTGHSSLSCLRSLPIDVVKVDRSFVHDVTAAPEDVSITRAIITLAQGLRMRVLVEGVETEGQLSLLAANRCDAVQGYWFSRPVPAPAFEQMLREDKRLPARYITQRGRQRTLLLVDDEENIVSSLKRLLRRDGYHIVTASNGAEALQRLTEHDVHVIVSDQRMPGMTGVELLRRAKELYPETVRLVLSGFTDLQSIIDAVNEGSIYRFLTKPWDDERLRAHIAEAFHQKQLADENRRLARQVEASHAEMSALNERLERSLAAQREQAELVLGSMGTVRDLMDQMPAVMLGIDDDGLISFANREAERQLPHGTALLGRPAAGLLWPEAAGLSDEQTVRLGQRVWQVTARRVDGRGHLLVFMPHVEEMV